ncbi:MAG: peptide-methionine (S)-S-oxide reductase MsrA [Gemmatimonadetes bacterium]|nr:peptide-methionine (S)-S-oxide reductase MsrA [Gemmatimonadota bacterium]
MIEHATLAGGCFWCLEAVFTQLRGVRRVASGYTGGRRMNPTYEQVCSGATGHAEVVRIEYDATEITFNDLLDVFFTIHDPTTLNRQGADTGTQYRSAVFFESPAQAEATRAKIAALTAEQVWDDPIVTEVAPLTQFFEAESYHQDYFARNPQNPYCAAVIAPKVAKARKVFFERLRATA